MSRMDAFGKSGGDAFIESERRARRVPAYVLSYHFIDASNAYRGINGPRLWAEDIVNYPAYVRTLRDRDFIVVTRVFHVEFKDEAGGGWRPILPDDTLDFEIAIIPVVRPPQLSVLKANTGIPTDTSGFLHGVIMQVGPWGSLPRSAVEPTLTAFVNWLIQIHSASRFVGIQIQEPGSARWLWNMLNGLHEFYPEN